MKWRWRALGQFAVIGGSMHRINAGITAIADVLLVSRLRAWYAGVAEPTRQIWYVLLLALAAVLLLPLVALVTPNFCASLDPNRYAIMDGAGGALLRAIFYRC